MVFINKFFYVRIPDSRFKDIAYADKISDRKGGGMTVTMLAERITRILMKLYSGEAVTLPALKEEFDVSERTIFRDLERMSAIVERNSQGEYQLIETFRVELQKKDLTRFAQITGTDKMLPDVRPEALMDILQSEPSDKLQVRSANFEEVSLHDPRFSKLRAAIAEHRICHLTYKDKARTLCPYRLSQNKGIWYLAATDNGQVKSFVVSRIELLNVSKDSFQPQQRIHDELDDEDDVWLNNSVIEVTIHVAQPVARYFLRRALLPRQEILETLKDGSLKIRSRARHENQILPILRFWIPHAHIVEPEALSQKIRKELQEYLGK